MTINVRWLHPRDRRRITPHQRRVRWAAAGFLFCLALVGTTAGACSGSAPTATNAQTAQNNLSGVISSEFRGAVSYPFASCDSSGNCKAQPPSDPLELQNLARRLVQYNSKGNTNYIYLLTYTGTPIGYYVIHGKVSSTGSQMTSTDMNVTCNGSSSCTNLAPGDDGSYGLDEGGSQGVFFFTSTGTLVETVMPWIVSSAPIPTFINVPQLQK